MSLIEVLVGLSLAGIVLAMLATLLVPTMRITRRGTVQVEMQQQALIVQRHLADDLGRSLPTAVSLVDQGASGRLYLGIARIKDISAALRQKQWERAEVLYTWDRSQQTITRTVFVAESLPNVLNLVLDGVRPRKFTLAEMQQICDDASLEHRPLAAGVTGFSLSALSTLPLVLTLDMQRTENTGRDQPETFHLSSAIAMRNSQP